MSEGPGIGLVADIGGTNARFALASDGRYGPIHSYRVADFATPADAAAAFLTECTPAQRPDRAVLAIAAPVDKGRGRLTNASWTFDAAALGKALGIPRLAVVNDFAALARGLPLFEAADLFAVGGAGEGGEGGEPDAARAVLGPGTGLGVAAFLPDGGPGAGIVLPTEGGHSTMPAVDEREARILAFLRERYDHVSAERVLSGPGLEALYAAVCAVDGREDAPVRTADGITAHALAGDCPASRATLDCFCAMLGGYAGDLALTLGAKGGVYIAGGIVPRFREYLAASDFRARFEAKGRFREWLAPIPIHVITHPDPAFPGLVAMAGE